MSDTFKSQVTIKFHQADPAGIMYFAHVFTLAHDTYENFVQACGFNWKDWFLAPQYIIPIRHTECDFLRPFRAGETYDIEAEVIEFSSTSFVMSYQFSKDKNKHAIVKMVHTCLDQKTFQKTELPEAIRNQFAKYHRKPPHA
jgi:acyl-CoA thioester hydrolase/1,4-dihydroxy-2-naphthoyl-CoA hydrolase